MGNIVAIVGRPNVGKSTLYNRLIGSQDAITDDVSGVTRDRKYGFCEWNGKRFSVIDTGGFVEGSDDIFEAAIRQQVRFAIDEASVILFMVDVQTGLTDLDESVANMLRRVKKPVFLVVNKVDNHKSTSDANEFYALGFENTFFLASISGSGTGDLLDAVTEMVENDPELDTELPKFSIVGRPNVGKSSLTNALLGEERNIVTDIAGTTRDPIHSLYNKFGKEFILIDTAGLRKKAKVHEDLEFYSVMRAIRVVEEADVTILVLDATQGIEAQDLAILRVAQRRHKGIVILVNKWDLVEKSTNTMRDYEKIIRKRIEPFDDVPVVFTSAIEKQRIFQAVDAAMDVWERRRMHIATSKLNDLMLPIIEATPPSSVKGRHAKFKYVMQIPKHAYPAFIFFVNNPNYVRENYKQFLENQIRKNFNFTGVPIEIFIREK
jgi:GTPase